MLVEESFEVKAPRERVWNTLRDPTLLGPCIPGCRGIEVVDAHRYKTVLGIKIGPIKAEFNLDVEVVDEQPMHTIVSEMRGEEGSRASQLRATNTVQITEIDADTTAVAYTSEVDVSGRLGRFGLGMMRKTASRLAAKFEASFKALAQAEPA